MKSKSSAVTKYCIDVLTYNGYFVWRQNNVGVFDPIKKIYRSNSSKKGVPDIIGITPTGKFIGIEVKIGKDKVSTFQLEFHQQAEKLGAVTAIVTEKNFVQVVKNIIDCDKSDIENNNNG